MSADAGRRPLSLVVTVAEALTLLAVLVFVVMLFANEPPDPADVADDAAGEVEDGGGEDGGGNGGEGDGGEDGGGEVIDGAVIYAGACASCHGSDGGGGIGPALAGGAVVEAFPDVADQITIVTEGDGGMPGFSSSLSPEEIEAVVLHTRENL